MFNDLEVRIYNLDPDNFDKDDTDGFAVVK